jgi:hypothetical protein
MLAPADGQERGIGTMESPGDFYGMALSDEQLTAGLIALHQERQAEWLALTRGARTALAGALRALAAVVDTPRSTATEDRPLLAART